MAGGRPSVYDTKIKPHLKSISILRANGTTFEELAVLLGVSNKTIYNYKNDIEEFLQSIKKGTDLLIDELEATLYDLAKGKVVRKKTKIEYYPDSSIRSKEETEEQLAPNVAALIFSLTNLAPDKWNNKQDVNLEVNDGIAPNFNDALREQHEKDTV